MTAASGLDLYQRFELEVRTPKRRLLVDAFLPAPEDIESVVTPPPPPPPLPGESTDGIGFGSLRDRADEEPPAPPPKPRRKKVAPRKPEKSKSLQEEIAEFMSRDGVGLAPEDETGVSQAPPDPNPDPDPDKQEK
jgi:hypothetical protein